MKAAALQQSTEALRHMMEEGIYISPSIDMQSFVEGTTRWEVEKDPLSSLNSQECQVFSLLIEGVRAKEIAARLSLSPKTVDSYRAGLMRKLDIHDLASLAKFAVHEN